MEDNQISLFDMEQPEKKKEKRVTPPKPQKTARTKSSKAKKGVVAKKAAPDKTGKGKSGLVPEGDVRLTANMRQDIHLRLKIAAATKRTTIGDLLEELVETYLDKI